MQKVLDFTRHLRMFFLENAIDKAERHI